jgi:16S rRNA pseudouridine516 synthase
MRSKRARLDRMIGSTLKISRRDAQLLITQQRVMVDGDPAVGACQLIDEFTKVVVDNLILQAKSPLYLMMHKPMGVVSATKDPSHTTVIDLLDPADREGLHIVGRLDFNSTGLILLTNNGRWSRELTEPNKKVPKRYRVTLANPITDEYVTAFAEGMYFAYEGITTQPATLEIVDAHTAHVVLVEGRYHQVKRMFGRFQNPVLTLHRLAIGNLYLDSNLTPGQYRYLTHDEVINI